MSFYGPFEDPFEARVSRMCCTGWAFDAAGKTLPGMLTHLHPILEYLGFESGSASSSSFLLIYTLGGNR